MEYPLIPDFSQEKKWKIVIDFHLLNGKIIGGAYSLPNKSGIVNHSRKVRYFSVFDLTSGFH